MLGGLWTNRLKLLILLAASNVGLLLYLALGELKLWADIDWMDVVGEGGSAAFTLLWIVLMLNSRPPGRVTNWLFAGLGCLFFSLWMDSLDEFIRIADGAVWDNWLESAPMPLGMVLLTIGLYHWHQEQLAINRQMEKRERLFREHLLFDSLTPLAGAEYLRRQLQVSMEAAAQQRKPLSLIALDLDDFSRINQQFGMEEGDRVLQAVTQLLLLNLRHNDLLCRLAGDRFVILATDTGESQACFLAQELKELVAALSYKHYQNGERVPLAASVAAVMATNESPESLLRRLNVSLAEVKRQLPDRQVLLQASGS